MIFVPNGANQGETATWLLYTADEHGIDRRSIKTTRGGFRVTEELAIHLGVAMAIPSTPEVPVVPETEVKEMPEVGSEYVPELPKPDVEIGEDGKVYLTTEAFLSSLEDGSVVVEDPSGPATPEVDREVVRAWAKGQGLNPAEKGALKKAVLEAYAEAHAER